MTSRSSTFVCVLASAAVLSALAAVSASAETLEVVHNFTGESDGANPVDGFVMGPPNILYGTASAGGASGLGVVFRVTVTGKVTVLHSFGGGADGATPNGRPIMDASLTLYGTTTAGGAAGAGTVFQVKGTTEKVLYSFAGGTDGADPQAGTKFSTIASVPGTGISGAWRNLLIDESGTIYGTTHCDGDYGDGTIFKLTPSGKRWTYTTLYSFTGGSDGEYTISNLVSRGGKLYGTTLEGGGNDAGVIYRITP